eukprot:scaffold109416_cov33-Tisochrysis_lutea.AAC.7
MARVRLPPASGIWIPDRFFGMSVDFARETLLHAQFRSNHRSVQSTIQLPGPHLGAQSHLELSCSLVAPNQGHLGRVGEHL